MKPLRRIPGGRSRGFVLLAVLGVLTVLIVYYAAAWSAVEMARLRGHRVSELEDRAEATASIVALALAHGGEWAGKAQSYPMGEPPRAGSVDFSYKTVTPDDPMWRRISGPRPLAGDALLTIRWAEGPSEYLINLQHTRPGAIALPAAGGSGASSSGAAITTTTTSATTKTATRMTSGTAMKVPPIPQP